MTFRSILLSVGAGLALALSLSACDSFADDIDGFIDRVDTDSLDQQSAVPFLATGVEEGFNDSYDGVAVLADLLSDAFIFDTDVQNATFPTFDEIDDAEILLSNNSVDGVYNDINEMRFLADDLLRRANETIEFSADDEGAEARRLALYTGNFYGGIARYMLATYFGLNPTEGGAPISESPDNLGPFIPSAQLYQQAIDRLTEAKNHTASDYETRLINTVLARIHLFQGNLAQAGTLAASGLTADDAPFTGDYSPSSQNNWYTQGGIGRTQVVVADRFEAFADAEAGPVRVEPAPVVNGVTEDYFRQALYLTPDASIPFASWEENALIRAEAALGTDATAALGFVNAVREAAGLDALESIDQAALIDARDLFLFTQGQRLVDMRRFGLPFVNHDGPVPGPWRYLPIPQNERNANPNF